MSQLKHRLRLAGLGLALLVTFTMSSAPAQAANPRGCMGTGTEVVYYSDASLTTEVGRYTTSCTGVCSGSGRVTSYFTAFDLGCPPPDNP